MMKPVENIAHWVFRVAEEYPHKVAYQTYPETQRTIFPSQLTFLELKEWVCRFAAGFKKLGIAPGQCVGLLIHNELSFVVSYFALMTLGVTVLPLNTRLTADELNV